MRVDQIMSRDAVCCRPEDTLDRAAEALWRNDCGCLPVVDPEGVLRAMVTDRDMCMAAFTTGRPMHEIHVEECMSPSAASCRADDPVSKAARTMAEHQVRRLPVIDGAGRVRGVLSVNDLLRAVSDGAPAADALTVLTAVARHPGESTPAPAPAAPEAKAVLKPAAKKKAATTKSKASKPRTKKKASKASPAGKKRRSKKA